MKDEERLSYLHIYLSIFCLARTWCFLQMSMSISDIYEAPMSPGTCCPGD